MLVDDLNMRYIETTKPEVRAFNESAANSFNCPILEDKRFPIGILSLQGKGDAEFSERLQDIAEPLASSIEFVIERDYDALTGLPKWPVFEQQLKDAYNENDGGYVVMSDDSHQNVSRSRKADLLAALG